MKAIQTYNLVITRGEFKGYFRAVCIESIEIADQLKRVFNDEYPDEPCEIVKGKIIYEADFNDLFD